MEKKIANLLENTVKTKFRLSLSYINKLTVNLSSVTN